MLSLCDAPEILEPSERRSSKPAKLRRVNRLNERRMDHVMRAVPEDHCRASSRHQWLTAMRAHASIGLLNAQRRARITSLCESLMSGLEAATMTVSPGWDYLTTRLGCSVATLSRDLRLLHDAGLLATVAKGRSARWTPKSSGQQINERAVYVLVVPLCLASVEKHATPTGSPDSSLPTHARGEVQGNSKSEAAPPPATPGTEPCGLGEPSESAYRRVQLWPRHATVAGKTRHAARAARLLAAEQLQRDTLALRGVSVRWIAAVCKPYFDAGWTIDDVCHAIDWLPGAGLRPHSATQGIIDPPRWLAGRLSAWMDHGRPMTSRRQRVAAEGALRAAQHRAEAERRQREADELAAAGGLSEQAARNQRGRDMCRRLVAEARARHGSSQT